jgi:RND family efflux transporter MFP subunit
MQPHENHDTQTGLTTPAPGDAPRATRPPSGRGGLGAIVVLGVVVALGVPVGLKIKSALEARKAMDAERTKTAQAAEEKAGAPKQMALVRPIKRAWLPTVPFDGTLMAAQEVDLAFRSPGTIAKITVKIGDRVEKGALLAALDTADLQASQAVAAAQVKAAQVQLGLANENNTLTTALIQSGSSPAVNAIQSNGNVGLASANLETARAQVASIGVAMRNTQITAPFAGTITQAPTAAGGVANPGVPQFHLVDVSSLRLVGTVSELDVPLVKVDAAVSIDGKPIEIGGGAKVKAVLPTLDPATRRVPVEAIVPNAAADGTSPRIAGAFVRASIAGGAKVDVLVLPGTALRPGTQDEIFVVDGGKAKVRRIAFTRGGDGELLVREGLGERDQVVEAPTADLVEGAPVVAGEGAPQPDAKKGDAKKGDAEKGGKETAK